MYDTQHSVLIEPLHLGGFQNKANNWNKINKINENPNCPYWQEAEHVASMYKL